MRTTAFTFAKIAILHRSSVLHFSVDVDLSDDNDLNVSNDDDISDDDGGAIRHRLKLIKRQHRLERAYARQQQMDRSLSDEYRPPVYFPFM